jgi:16S rRNA (guanine966-N2)-methyltransferase
VRIIGGVHKGKNINPPKGLTLRPTTDFAKEALFNILNNKIDFEGIDVLDLFCGLGGISFEFASRGSHVNSVDANFNCLKFIKSTASDLKLNIQINKADVFKFLQKELKQYDLIFADPPYDLTNIAQIYELVMEKKLLKENGWLIIEHGPKTNLSALPYFIEHRKYGNVNFSFFNFVKT